MDVSTIFKELKQGVTRRFYIFTGPEWAMEQIYIDQIEQCLKKEFGTVQRKRIDSVADVLSKTGTRSFIQSHNLYIVRDDKQLLTEEKLQKRLPDVLKNNTVILLLTNPDKRTKFYKSYQSEIVEFEQIKDKQLKKYIKNQCSLNDRNIEKLMQVCEYDYGRCLLEIDKIKAFMKGGKEAYPENYTDSCFTTLIEDGTIFIPPQDAIFDFVDAVLHWQPKTAFRLYKDCLGVGEATMVMISVLYTNAKAVLQVQSCDSNDISKTTGLTGWQIQNAKKHLNIRSNSDLLFIMELCVKAEQGIKTGKVDEKYAMEYILVNALY